MAEDGGAKQEYTANQVQRNGNSTKTLENAHDTSQKMEGWLLKKQKVSNKWRNQYFKLTGTELCYGNSTESIKKKIILTESELNDSSIDNRDFVFRIKPHGSKRTYYFQASSLQDQQNWMQAICFAKAAGSGSKSEACVLQ